MLDYYPPKEKMIQKILDKWIMKGVDCSGLLYEATNGYTPRNSSDLVTYGTGVTIENMTRKKL